MGIMRSRKQALRLEMMKIQKTKPTGQTNWSTGSNSIRPKITVNIDVSKMFMIALTLMFTSSFSMMIMSFSD